MLSFAFIVDCPDQASLERFFFSMLPAIVVLSWLAYVVGSTHHTTPKTTPSASRTGTESCRSFIDIDCLSSSAKMISTASIQTTEYV